MYNIGFIKPEKAIIKENGVDKEIKWMECYFMVPGLERFQAKLVANKNKNGDNSPDYYLYRRGRFNKNLSFRDIKIGTLWLKEKNGEKYMSGFMLLGDKEVRIGVFAAKPLYEGEKLNYLYDIVMFTESQQNNNEYSRVEPESDISRESEYHNIEIDDSEIPF